MGSISKQGSRFLRYLLVEAANSVVRFDPDFRKYYAHRCHHEHRCFLSGLGIELIDMCERELSGACQN